MSRDQRAMDRPRGRGPCGKARYPSRGAARRAYLRIIAKGSADPAHDWLLHEYFCDDCEAYHVGHDWRLAPAAAIPTAESIWGQRCGATA